MSFDFSLWLRNIMVFPKSGYQTLLPPTLNKPIPNYAKNTCQSKPPKKTQTTSFEETLRSSVLVFFLLGRDGRVPPLVDWSRQPHPRDPLALQWWSHGGSWLILSDLVLLKKSGQVVFLEKPLGLTIWHLLGEYLDVFRKLPKGNS